MTATDELRKLLDERGVEWSDASDDDIQHTTWNTASCWFSEFGDGWTSWGMSKPGTPEQAIAATLGTPISADLRTALDFMRIWITEDAHLGESAISYEFEKAEGLWKLDAIESAIAATLGSGTCEFTIEYDRDEVERRRKMYEENPLDLFPQDMPESAWTCSNCGQQFKCHYDRQTGDLLPVPDWMKCCPSCGKRIRKAVDA